MWYPVEVLAAAADAVHRAGCRDPGCNNVLPAHIVAAEAALNAAEPFLRTAGTERQELDDVGRMLDGVAAELLKETAQRVRAARYLAGAFVRLYAGDPGKGDAVELARQVLAALDQDSAPGGMWRDQPPDYA